MYDNKSDSEGVRKIDMLPTVAKLTKMLIRIRTDTHKYYNQYKVVGEIGRGQFGKVKLCIDERGNAYAVKICRKPRKRHFGSFGKAYLESIKMEIDIMKKLQHPNVVRVWEVVDLPQESKAYMFMDYLSRGCVNYKDEKGEPVLSIKEAHKYFGHLVSGLKYLHGLEIIHRDIKPENLLLSDNNILKIADFNSAQLAGKKIKTSAGTPAFYSPELCIADNNTPVTFAVDIWAAGICLYLFVYGRFPFDILHTQAHESSSLGRLHHCIMSRPLTFPKFRKANSLLKELLKGLLNKTPHSRLTIEEVSSRPWVVRQPTWFWMFTLLFSSCSIQDTRVD
jgi:serine/threonine protein kinase